MSLRVNPAIIHNLTNGAPPCQLCTTRNSVSICYCYLGLFKFVYRVLENGIVASFLTHITKILLFEVFH